MHRIVVLALVAWACSAARTTPCVAAEPQSLLETIAEWQYPGAALTATQGLARVGWGSTLSVIHKSQAV